MKRTLAALAVLAVLAGGTVNALSVLPHTHGGDLDHSRHASCPVHQAEIQGFQASVDVTPAHFIFPVSKFLDTSVFLPSFQNISFFQSLRAPPVLPFVS